MKSANKICLGVAALTAAICIGAATHTADAAPVTDTSPRVTLNGESYAGDVRLKDGITYVKIREFSESLGAKVTWEPSSETAKVSHRGVTTILGCNDTYLINGGEYLLFDGQSFVENERIYVPLRAIGGVFGFDTAWDSEDFCASLTKNHVSPSYSEDDVYWLSRIISAEAEGESYMGKLAVGTVVLNRVKANEFPSTIYGVIFDRKNGTQFTPVANGTIYKTPDGDSIKAAKACLEGELIDPDILYFMNASLSESFWICYNRQYIMTVGNHDFYA